MPTPLSGGWIGAALPKNGAEPKLKTPPSAATRL